MSEQPIGTPVPEDKSVEGAGSGLEFSGEFGEREGGDTDFSGEFGEREHEGRENISREAPFEPPME